MKTIYISKKEFKNLEPLCTLNKGSFGACYRYNDLVLKKIDYKKMKKHKININIEEQIKTLSKFECEGIAFPIDEVCINKKSYSYTMPEIKGIRLDTLSNLINCDEYDLTLDEFEKLYYSGIEKINYLTSKGIKVSDLRNVNSKYNPIDNSFGIFDLDFYKTNSNLSHEELEKKNYFEYNFNLLKFFIEKISSGRSRMLNEMIGPEHLTSGHYIDDMYDTFKQKNGKIKSLVNLTETYF